MTGLSIVIMDLVELMHKPTVSASNVGFLMHPIYSGPPLSGSYQPYWLGEEKNGGVELDNVVLAHCLDMCIISKVLQCLF